MRDFYIAGGLAGLLIFTMIDWTEKKSTAPVPVNIQYEAEVIGMSDEEIFEENDDEVLTKVIAPINIRTTEKSSRKRVLMAKPDYSKEEVIAINKSLKKIFATRDRIRKQRLERARKQKEAEETRFNTLVEDFNVEPETATAILSEEQQIIKEMLALHTGGAYRDIASEDPLEDLNRRLEQYKEEVIKEIGIDAYSAVFEEVD